jgi:hypothetical protein
MKYYKIISTRSPQSPPPPKRALGVRAQKCPAPGGPNRFCGCRWPRKLTGITVFAPSRGGETGGAAMLAAVYRPHRLPWQQPDHYFPMPLLRMTVLCCQIASVTKHDLRLGLWWLVE